ncbi:unnamed protein product [Brachionus calyciflorus]|uniref:Uncharacterized protein n=1 Tax=Brachionus calyciflorus TaxID=104777 RepID=A0A814GP68_9BILA|nr:unnamed protein product [Brachionus calyciflorus]
MSLNDTPGETIAKQEPNESTPNYFLLSNSKFNKNDSQETLSQSDSVFRNPNSIESFTAPSPAGSLIEQFDNNTMATTPLSVDDNSDMTNTESSSNSQATFSQVNLKLSQSFDNPNFRFRRHSSQSSINLPLNLQINNNNNSSSTNLVSPLTLTSSFTNLNSTSNFTNPERVCSSPVSNLKMSSRVCQIKIDEGIEPHLSREIKSERETTNTLKLKSSCDELVINNDDLGLDSFGFDREQNRANSPNFLNSSNSSSTFKRYRTFSESQNNQNNNLNHHGNMPSPSISSCQSYSNSSSPTNFTTNNNHAPSNPGLLRCFSPSTTLTNQNLNQSQLNQNYFSQSPSPTRKLFVTRRSMSPVPCSIRPSSFNPSNLVNNKRKISDVDQVDLNGTASSSFHSPKRSLVDQEFVQPLLMCAGNNQNITRIVNRSATSSPSATMMNQMPLSPRTMNSKIKKMDEETNKYTFVPIQLPPPSSSPGPVQNAIFQPPPNQLQNKRLGVLTNNSVSVSGNQTIDNSPTNYLCDSPISCSPSVSSNISTSCFVGDKPDSGYQSSAQNNSDSESCT